MRVFHVSDRPGIAVFTPRPVRRDVWPELAGSRVWAVSEEMVHNYYLPRDCPRVCWTIGPRTTREEQDLFLEAAGGHRAIITAPSRWRQAIEQCVLHRYELAFDSFWPVDYDAGYYVSDREQRPIDVVELRSLPQALDSSRVLLEYRDDLEPLRLRMLSSGYRFSIIRMVNPRHPQ